MSLPSDVVQAVERYGPRLDKLAKSRYGIDGTTLLAKLIQGESGGRKDAVSSAGARAWAQFMPSTRQGVIQRFGIDPWRSADEAAHAAVLHLTGKLGNRPGLEGYNPGGGQSYVHYILGQKVNLGSAPVGRSAPVSGSQTVQTTYSSPSMPTSPTGLADLLRATMVSNKGGVGGIAPPSFAAKPHLPANALQLPSVSGGGGVSQATTDAIQQAMGLRGPELGSATTTTTPGPSPSSPGGPTYYGRVVVAPGANRAGVGLQKPVVNFVKKTAAIFGKPIQITTGTNHNEYVAGTNRVSDHWAGNAVDIAVPVDGPRGDRIAASALEAAGINPKQAVRMAQRGGLYNVNVNGRRLQVIWKTNEGGDHHNHVHIGYR